MSEVGDAKRGWDYAPAVGLMASLFLFGVTKIDSPAPGLDPSWRTGVNLANTAGMRFGHDIIFTFGPLGFLDTAQSLSRPQFMLSLAFSLVATAMLWTAVYVGLARAMHRITAAVISAVLVGVVSGTEIVMPSMLIVISASIMALLFIKGDGTGHLRWTPPVVAATAAVLLQVKFPEGLVLVAVAGLCVLFSPSRTVRTVIESALAFCTTFAVGWSLTGQALGDIPQWMAHSLDIALGYSEAMAIENPPNSYTYPLAILLVIALVTFTMRWTATESRRARLGVFLVVICLLFFSFKQGFTRHDTHDRLFFAVTAALLATLLGAAKRPPVVMSMLAGISLLAVSLVFASAGLTRFNPVVASQVWKSNLQLLVDHDYRQRLLQGAAVAARSHYVVPANIVSSAQGHPVSVDPWEVTLAWAYDFNWHPVPIFQAYAAYTATLDQINADAIAGAPPDQVVIRGLPQSIDGRNPMWDTPRYLLALACNYDVGPSDNNWMMLRKNDQRCSAFTEGSTTRVEVGTRVILPDVRDGQILVGRFTPDALSPPRTIGSALWKDLPPLLVRADGVGYRLPRGLADGPLLLHLPESLGWRTPHGGSLDYKELTFSQPGTLQLETVTVER